MIRVPARESLSHHAQFDYVSVKDDVITLVDLDGFKSITNDAEWVVKAVIHAKGRMNSKGEPWHIHYYDTMGNLDELLHSGGEFTGFQAIQVEGRKR